MPSSNLGSVSARLSVCDSRVNAARNCSSVAPSTSSPPGSCAASARPPRRTWSDARCFVPASVSSKVPCGKSNAATIIIRSDVSNALINYRLDLFRRETLGDNQIWKEQRHRDKKEYESRHECEES